MTVVDTIAPRRYQPVVVDLYRDVHKSIRADLFALTSAAGASDPSDPAALRAVADHLVGTVAFLDLHAANEDAHIVSVLAEHRPELAAAIEHDYPALRARLGELQECAGEVDQAADEKRRALVQRLYIELASFTSAYLAHQDFEERVVMIELDRATGSDAVAALDEAFIASIEPDNMMRALALMLPAMSNDERADLGGIQMGAPPEVFEHVWGLTASALEPADLAALERRLGGAR